MTSPVFPRRAFVVSPRVMTPTRWAPSFRFLWTGGLALLLCSDLAAQSPRDRDALAGFVDSLAAASDNDAIRELERSLMVRARRDRSNPGIHMRLGLIALRLGEFTGAASEFKWATQLAPQWGSAWFGWGQAELGLGEGADTSRIGRRAILSRDAFERASQAFSRAVTIDSSLAPAAERVARERVAADRVPSADVVRSALRRAVLARTRNGASFLALGQVEALLGDTVAALIAFDAAAVTPAGRGPGLLAAARLRLVRPGDDRAFPSYYEAATIDDSVVVAGLRRDIAWIATADELVEFDGRRGVGRAAFLRRFWTGRDRQDLRVTGHRLRTHYQRLNSAGRIFLNPDDQRVAVWVRHGEPDGRATLRLPELRQNESWRYRWPDGELLVHFVAGADTTHFRIVESVFDVVADQAGVPAGGDGELAGGLVDQVLRSRAQLSPFYQAAVAGRREQLTAFWVRERELSQAGKNLALTTDRDPLRFERDLPARFQIVSLEGWADSGSVRVLFVVPGFALDSVAGSTGGVQARVRMVAWDSTGEASNAIDTVVILERSQEAGPRTAWRGQVAVPVPAGRYSARAAIEVGNRGLMAMRGAIRVGSDRLPAMADLTIGTVSGEVVWPNADESTVVADPGLAFEQSDSLVVSAALVGPADPDARFRIWLRPVRADGGKAEKWRTWPGAGNWHPVVTGRDGQVRATAVVSARGLKPGRYEVELVVVDPRDRSARAPGRFTIADPGK